MVMWMGMEVAWDMVPGMAVQREEGMVLGGTEQGWVQGLEQGGMAAFEEGRMEGVGPMVGVERLGRRLAMGVTIRTDGLKSATFPSCHAQNLRVYALGSWSGLVRIEKI